MAPVCHPAPDGSGVWNTDTYSGRSPNSIIFDSSQGHSDINGNIHEKQQSHFLQQIRSRCTLSLPSTRADETFGHYCDESLEEEGTTLHRATSIQSMSTISTSNSPQSTIRSEYFSIDNKDADEANVVFVFDNSRAPVSCRSFESMVNAQMTQVFVSIEGFRIVQDDTGERAEFKVRILVNSKDIVGWKSFAHFEELAAALEEFSSVEVVSTSWTSIFCPTAAPLLSRLLRRSEASIDLTKSLVAWEKVREGRFWGWSFSHNLSVKKLMQDSHNLETFLRNVLFEIPTPDIIVEFVSTY